MYACKIALGALALLGFVACGGSVSPGSGQLADAATLVDQSVASPAPDASQTTFNSPADTGPAQTPDVMLPDALRSGPDSATDTASHGRDASGSRTCSGKTDCRSCSETLGCGWCGASGTCLDGATAGPINAVCASGWAIEYDSCPNLGCEHFADCVTCGDASGCGWCGATGKCMNGTTTGPIGATCASGWAIESIACPGHGCERHADCGNCTDDFNCGWCGATGKCVRGEYQGPIGSTCALDWASTNSSCPNSGCSRYSNCGDCGNDFDCGWCGATGTCMARDFSGPVGATCSSGWAGTTMDCPNSGCERYTDCTSCTEDNLCGFCAGTQTCLGGVPEGPINAVCSAGWTPFTTGCGK